jgi:transcriptional regulator with XRE-family HTH domain
MLTDFKAADSGYRALLWQELADRKAHNPQYSLRAFARDLGISVTALSQALSSKRHLSKKNLLKVAEKLALSPNQVRRLLESIYSTEAREENSNEHRQLEEDCFRIMSDWYFYAILNLARLKDNRADPRWIADRLQISSIEAKNALLILRRSGFIVIQDGKLSRRAAPLLFTPKTNIPALTKFQKQNLKAAEKSLDLDPVEARYLVSFVMPADVGKIEAAKEMILKFQKRMTKFLESGSPTEVYSLSIQLFPLSRKRTNS